MRMARATRFVFNQGFTVGIRGKGTSLLGVATTSSWNTETFDHQSDGLTETLQAPLVF